MAGDDAGTGAGTARWRVLARRWLCVGFVVVQAGFVVRAYWAPHMEFGYQMFPEASTWRAEIVRVTVDGDRVPVTEAWSGYDWSTLVDDPGIAHADRRRHANAGIDNQLALLDEALAWVADHTPRDTETRYYEAAVTTWYNDDAPTTSVLRSPERDVP